LFEINYYSNNGIAMSFNVLLDNQVLISTLYWQRIFEDVNHFSVNHSAVTTNACIERK